MRVFTRDQPVSSRVTAGALLAWPTLGSFAGGVGAVALALGFRKHRGRPGVDWFLGVFIAQAIWCLSYGAGLLVDHRLARSALEATTWIGIVWTGIAFLGFALGYTGRSDVRRSRLFTVVLGFGALSTVLIATNAVHGLIWTGLRIDPVFGVSTVSYTLGLWAVLVVAVETVLVASGVFLLVDTLLSYGPLYKRESAAVALSSLPPGLALVGWALGVGPTPQLQLAPVLFVPHVLLDAYAFRRASMFERHPTTSRAAERTAIDDLDDPVAVLALDRRVVRLNPAAARVFGCDTEAARERPIDELVDAPVDLEADGETVGLDVDGVPRSYQLSVSRLTDPSAAHVGYTVVLSDVTERERRRQRLEVLTRVLRHNLRNDAGVLTGYGELLADRLDDPELERMADAVERRADALAGLGEKASTVDSVLAAGDPVTVDVREEVDAVVTAARKRAPNASVECVVDESATTTTHARRDAVRAILENTVENALDHHDGEGTTRDDGRAWTRVTLRSATADSADGAGEDELEIVVEDDGPGIPDHELSAVESGRETALEHGSGLGLWVIEWSAGTLGATVTYAERTPRGTKVSVRIPTSAVSRSGSEAPA